MPRLVITLECSWRGRWPRPGFAALNRDLVVVVAGGIEHEPGGGTLSAVPIHRAGSTDVSRSGMRRVWG